jgi:hypothetical protein
MSRVLSTWLPKPLLTYSARRPYDATNIWPQVGAAQ